MSKFNILFRDLILNQNISYKKLAMSSGLTKNTIYNLANNSNCTTTKTLIRLEHQLGVNLYDLYKKYSSELFEYENKLNSNLLNKDFGSLRSNFQLYDTLLENSKKNLDLSDISYFSSIDLLFKYIIQSNFHDYKYFDRILNYLNKKYQSENIFKYKNINFDPVDFRHILLLFYIDFNNNNMQSFSIVRYVLSYNSFSYDTYIKVLIAYCYYYYNTKDFNASIQLSKLGLKVCLRCNLNKYIPYLLYYKYINEYNLNNKETLKTLSELNFTYYSLYNKCLEDYNPNHFIIV